MAELSEVKKLVLGLSDREIMALLGLRSGKNKRNTDSSGRADGSWILPIVFVLLKTLEVDRTYICVFFATILALSNTGGAASPIGDFPAIVIMTSGITSFISYLTHAFPLFALTSAVLIAVWGMRTDPRNTQLMILRRKKLSQPNTFCHTFFPCLPLILLFGIKWFCF